uniref:Disease resistance N-terminal domain-containing protein n=1 Tax=Aegilops tauschii TaxID=37682 RepID=M8CWY1_AEGTA
MAEYAVNSMANAVTNELISRVFSGLVQKYGKDAATSEKLQRLEMLLIKINSTIEMSEKRTMESTSLLQWRDKLKEAASEGDEVLSSFPQRPKDAQATSNANNGNQQQGEAVSSSAVAPAPTADVGPLSFTRTSVNNMLTIKKGILNIKLRYRPVACRGNDKKCTNSGHMGHRSKSLVIITTMPRSQDEQQPDDKKLAQEQQHQRWEIQSDQQADEDENENASHK